jgi:hypothetical protein
MMVDAPPPPPPDPPPEASIEPEDLAPDGPAIELEEELPEPVLAPEGEAEMPEGVEAESMDAKAPEEVLPPAEAVEAVEPEPEPEPQDEPDEVLPPAEAVEAVEPEPEPEPQDEPDEVLPQAEAVEAVEPEPEPQDEPENETTPEEVLPPAEAVEAVEPEPEPEPQDEPDEVLPQAEELEAAPAAAQNPPDTLENRWSLENLIGRERYAIYEPQVAAIAEGDPTLDGISHADLVAIRAFTSESDVQGVLSDYQVLNSYLRTGDNVGMRRTDAYVERISHGLDAMPICEGNVYCGLDMSPAMTDAYRDALTSGESLTELGFRSTSREEISSLHQDDLVVIYSETGRDVSSVSTFPNEQEVAFAPGTAFRVIHNAEHPITGGQVWYLVESRS